MNGVIRCNLIAASCSFAFAAYSGSAELAPPRDGWTSWEVAAVDDAPAWCCFDDGRPSAANATACRLDDKQINYGNRDGSTTDTVRIYARFNGGTLERVRAYASNCPVRAEGPIQTLSDVSDDASARWLAGMLKSRDKIAARWLRTDLIAALAVHRTNVARAALTNIAHQDARRDNRQDAVFWLAHVRGQDGARIATAIMFDDPQPKMREHAAFAVAQSQSLQKESDLIRLANSDRNAGVRSQAWFWLAQTAAPATEAAISAALNREAEPRVRDQAIFALAQLPDDRAARALIAVAENRALRRDDRKQAMFWLAQEDSAAAIAYLDKVMMNASR